MMCPRITSQVFPGTLIAASKPRRELSSTAISWATTERMTAGSGINHQEMPRGDQVGGMHGFHGGRTFRLDSK